MITMSYSRSTEVLKWTVKAYCEQAAFPRDRVKMIAQKGLLASLTVLSANENEFVMKHAREVLSALACEFAVILIMLRYGIKLLLTVFSLQTADVANAKNIGVEKVLRCISSTKESQDALESCRNRPRYYSPSSVAQFHFDFSGLI